MQIYKDGNVIYNGIDNTGASDLAALGAQYAKGRLDTLDGKFNGYYTKSEVLDLLTGVAATLIVATLPAEPEANTYYLVGNDGEGYTLHYYDTELEHAIVGSYELDLSSAIPQRDVMPEAGDGLSGKVYQYTGTTQSQYVRGKWYVCLHVSYYGWLNTLSSGNRYTRTETPSVGTYMYESTGERYANNVSYVNGSYSSIKDAIEIPYARNDAADFQLWQWIDLADGALATIWNANLPANKVLTSDTDGKVTASSVTPTELGMLSGASSNIQNQLDNIDVAKIKASAISKVIPVSDASDDKIPTEKAVSTFAVAKLSLGRGIGQWGEYVGHINAAVAEKDNYKLVGVKYDQFGHVTAKDSSEYDVSTSVGSSSTNLQLATAKAVYGFAVPQTSTGNRIYGTNSSGGETQYPFSDTYNSTASNQLFTRAGAYNLYSAVRNGVQGMVFCGNFTRNSTQSVSSNTSVRIQLTASDIYRTNLVSLASNAVKVLVAGTYQIRIVGRLADTAGATRAWYLGGGNTSTMADDQMGGVWSYTYNRHKAEATYLKYCAANELLAPWVYIDSNSGTLNYVTVEVFKLNDK